MNADVIHRSKIGLEILVPLILVLGSVMTIMIINLVWLGMFICMLIIFLVINIYTGTLYKITTDNQILIQCGIIESYTIDIIDIEWIKDTKGIMSVISAPALSSDRLEINYKGGSVLVSPKDKKKFIANLKEINPKIWYTSYSP